MSEPVCPRAGQMIGGCTFVARYDQTVPSALADLLAQTTSLKLGPGETLRVQTVPVYVRDICVRSGRTVERADREKNA